MKSETETATGMPAEIQSCSGQPELIVTPAKLVALSAYLRRCSAVAVDTEFIWERTYYPILGVVQVATPDGCWLVDAMALDDLSVLGKVLAAPEVMKVLHDAPQDLVILSRATRSLPRNLFDTRQAAGFAGYPSIASLQTLLHDTMGISLSKSETRSDWVRRPLTERQIRYAAEDVTHLLALRDHLLDRCVSDSARDGLQEERATLEDPKRYAVRDPRTLYLRVKGYTRLDARQLAVLREAAAWREEEAMKRDWPRAHVLSDTLLLAIASEPPMTRDALQRVPRFPERMPDDATARLLAAVAVGVALPENACPQPACRGSRQQQQALKTRSDTLLASIREVCRPLGIDPALVASRSEVAAYLRRSDEMDMERCAPMMKGWRAALLREIQH